ncbi:hypothetical protein RUM43_006529 [Polyplax serrata]|uniref:Ig-like domain-containing protein n=1 Tax=Polyplax serrata TaxID=468196 RepID=A0AAN8NS83_POLSC
MLLFPIAESVVVQTVKSGETAILPCPSDDKIHRFQYWLLKNDMTIGPWNSSNTFRYEVWSGQLIIKNVTEEDSGLYQCFSKKLMGRELKSETVSLLVQIEVEKSTAKDTQNQKRPPSGLRSQSIKPEVSLQPNRRVWKRILSKIYGSKSA